MTFMDWWKSANDVLKSRDQVEMTFQEALEIYKATQARIERRKMQEARFALTKAVS